MADEERDPEEDRARALALLAATHKFPTEYHVSVIALNVDTVVEEVRAAVEYGLPTPLPDQAYDTVPSRAGRYASHRFSVPCASPEEVLELYARIKAVKGVMNIF